MDNVKENLSRAFEASLSFGFKEETIDKISIAQEDEFISKYAGVYIYQPTLDNIEEFVLKYTLNEIGSVQGIKANSVKIVPSLFDKNSPNYVVDGSGLVSLSVANVAIELPFLIVDGEFMPFDVIKMEDQKVPYSKENLQKIISEIEKAKANAQDANIAGDFTPYKKVDKPINPSSTTGFLGNILRVQEQRRSSTAIPGGSFVTASELIDDSLEKLATMTPVTNKDWAQMENIVRKAYTKKAVEGLRKQASEVKESSDVKLSGLYEKFRSMPFVDAASLPHGTVVKFPMIQGHDIMMEDGIILEKFIEFAGTKISKLKILVSKHATLKVLGKDSVMCLKANGDGFKFPTKPLSSLEKDDIFFAFNGDQAFAPSSVNYIRSVILAPTGHQDYGTALGIGDKEIPKSSALGKTETKIINFRPMNYCDDAMSLFGASEESKVLFSSNPSYSLTLLEGKKFAEIPYGDFIKAMSIEAGVEENTLRPSLTEYNVVNNTENKKILGCVLCSDANTKIIKIVGPITGYLNRKEDLEKMVNSVYSDGMTIGKLSEDSNEDLEKSAMSLGSTKSIIKNVVKGTEKTIAPKFNTLSEAATHSAKGDWSALERKGLVTDGKVNADFNHSAGNLKGKTYDDLHAHYTKNLASDFKPATATATPSVAKPLSVSDQAAYNARQDASKLTAQGKMNGGKVNEDFTLLGQNMKGKSESDIASHYLKHLSKTSEMDFDLGFEKTAGQNEYVELRTADKEKGTYNLKISHVDRSKTMLKTVNRDFKGMPHYEIRETLKAVGFDLNKIGEILSKARHEGFAHYELPANATPSTLTGGQVTNAVNRTMDKVKKTLYDADIPNAIAATAIGTLMAGIALSGTDAGNAVLSAVQKMSAEGCALSQVFEKVAIDKESKAMSEVAKLMTVSYHLNEKLAHVIKGEAQYLKLNDVIKNINDSTLYLEKVASELLHLKADQLTNKTVIVDNGYIKGAIKHIDNIHQLARALK